MRLNSVRFPAMIAIIATLILASSAGADVLWNQPFDETGSAYLSQNDTNGLGNFATMYDNFRLSARGIIGNVQFTGEYAPFQGPITGWTIQFWSDNFGQPGSSLYSEHIVGNGNESFLGSYGGFPTYTYSLDITGFLYLYPGTYWLSVVPDLGFPPLWGWSTGTGGDGISYQDYFGTRSQIAADMAFTINSGGGCCGVPEPASLLLVGSGLFGAAGLARKRLGRR